jgi:membrane-associated protease RseP (regulator of RpoE activity)
MMGRFTALVVLLATGACASGAHAAPPATTPRRAGEADKNDTRVLIIGPEHERVRVARVSRGYLGVELTDLTPELREHFGAAKDNGVIVSRVVPNGPAAKAGVKVGDVITGVDGQPVGDSGDLRRLVRDKAEKQSADVQLVRNRSRQTVKVAVEHRPTGEIDLAGVIRQRPVVVDTVRINDAIQRAMRERQSRAQTEEKLQQRTRQLEERLEKLERELRERGHSGVTPPPTPTGKPPPTPPPAKK